jgi:hypothetical protein
LADHHWSYRTFYSWQITIKIVSGVERSGIPDTIG